LIGLVEGNIIEEPKEMVDVGIGLVGHIVFDGFSLLNRFIQVIGKIDVIALFEPKDEMAATSFEVLYVGGIGTETVLSDDDFKMRVIFSEFY
jgi:hypothetical protein